MNKVRLELNWKVELWQSSRLLCVFTRLEELKQVQRRHALDREERARELQELQEECVKINKEAPTLADRFRFYQDLRGYVTDLVECLDEKVGGSNVSLGGFTLATASDTYFTH